MPMGFALISTLLHFGFQTHPTACQHEAESPMSTTSIVGWTTYTAGGVELRRYDSALARGSTLFRRTRHARSPHLPGRQTTPGKGYRVLT